MFRLALQLFFLIGLSSFALDLSTDIKSGIFWKKPAVESLQGIHVSTPDPDHLRTSGLNIGSLATGEAIVTQEKGNPVSLQVMLYNKGDDGPTDEESFHSSIQEALAALDELTGGKSKFRSGNNRDAGIKLKTWEWKWENGFIRLEANSSGKKKKFQGEFIRLQLAADAAALSKGGASDNISRHELKSAITTEEDGTVWLKGVPMVDQGYKGYCMPATLARIFAFYGMDKIDQHALADLCDSGTGGTSSRGMEQAMERVCKKFHTKFIVLEDYSTTLKSVIEPYNKLARRADKPTMSLYSDVYGTADAELLRKARAGKTSQVNKWLKDIRKAIDSGSPVVWLVMVGIYPEEIPLPQTRGGHARLITGYNLKEKTIIYTDSWGAEHARKTMPAADAMGMTMGRYIIKLR